MRRHSKRQDLKLTGALKLCGIITIFTIVIANLGGCALKNRLPRKERNKVEYELEISDVDIMPEDTPSNIEETIETTKKVEETKIDDLELFDNVVDKFIKIDGDKKYVMKKVTEESEDNDVFYDETSTTKNLKVVEDIVEEETVNVAEDSQYTIIDPTINIGRTNDFTSFMNIRYNKTGYIDTYMQNGNPVEFDKIKQKEKQMYILANVVGNEIIWQVIPKNGTTEKVEDSATNSELKETEESYRDDITETKKVKTIIKESTQMRYDTDPNILTYEEKYPYLYNFEFETKHIETTTAAQIIETKSNSSQIEKKVEKGTTAPLTSSLTANSKVLKLRGINGYTITANSATEALYTNNTDNSQYMSVSFGSAAILLSKISNKLKLKNIYGTGVTSLIDPTSLSCNYAMEIKEYEFAPDITTDKIFSHAIIKIDNSTSMLILNESGMKSGKSLANEIIKNVEVALK